METPKADANVLAIEIGKTAPETAALSASGDGLLREHWKGKFVLLVFWSLKEPGGADHFEHLKEIRRSFAKDNRMLILSVCADDVFDEGIFISSWRSTAKLVFISPGPTRGFCPSTLMLRGGHLICGFVDLRMHPAGESALYFKGTVGALVGCPAQSTTSKVDGGPAAELDPRFTLDRYGTHAQ